MRSTVRYALAVLGLGAFMLSAHTARADVVFTNSNGMSVQVDTIGGHQGEIDELLFGTMTPTGYYTYSSFTTFTTPSGAT